VGGRGAVLAAGGVARRARRVTTLTAMRLADVAVGRPSGALKHESD
jgi:hypothetical protein